jgi:Cdc6-like AAA superfamily ATPase
VASFVASKVHAETLLAFLIAGFIVQNFSRHGHTLVHAFERIALPVFVIYFAAQAAALDLVSVTVYLPLTLALVAVRVSVFYFGVGFGAKLVNIDEAARRNLQMSFYSQGGVDLVLAAMIVEAIPSWGAHVQTVTMATVLIYVIAGPPLLARALDRMGESAAARERGAEQLEAEAAHAAEIAEPESFVAPSAEDPRLQARLTSLHELVVELAEVEIGAGIRERAATRKAELCSAAAQIRASLEFEHGPPSAAALRERVQRLDVELTACARGWPELALTPFDRPQLEQLLARLASALPFSATHRVTREDRLFEPKGSRFARVIRASRRLRRSIAGRGARTIALGRLWRYHLTLEVPVSLWSTMRFGEALAWHRLLEHYRITRTQLEALAGGEWRQLALEFSGPQGGQDHGHEGHDEGHDTDHGHESEPEDEHGEHDHAPEPAVELDIEDVRAAVLERACAREQALLALLDELDSPLEQGFVTALSRAWSGFVESVELAGTLELPAWRYRPSRRYDTAQAATAELRERSDDDRETAGGRRDALRTLVEARCLAALAHTRAEQFGTRLHEGLAPIRVGLDQALVDARKLTDVEGEQLAAVERGRVLADDIQRVITALDHLRRGLAELQLSDLGEPGRALGEIPEQLSPSLELASAPELAGRAAAKRAPLRLRAWLGQTLARELRATLAGVEDELAAGLSGVRVAVSHARQVLDYHLGHDSGAAPQIDEGLGERIAALIVRAREQLDELTDAGTTHVRDKLGEAEAEALEPLLEARWEEIRRRSRRFDDGRSVATIGAWLQERGRGVGERARELARRTNEELDAVLSDRPTVGESEAFRGLLLGPRSSMPEAYQRLFTSVPAEIVGLLIDRPELVDLRQAVERWRAGRGGGPILIWGERGAGKRTLIRQVIGDLEQARAVDPSATEIQRKWLRLSPTFEREADVTREFASILGVGVGSATHFGELLHSLRAAPSFSRPPTLVVVENTERLFRRTPEGLETVRRLLALIAASSGQILWVVLMADAAVRVLDPALELRGRFPLALHVPPVDAKQLERVLDARHRLSGYRLRCEPGRPTLHEWLRHPASAWRQRRDHDLATSERIAALSAGNIRQALRMWLAAAHIDERDPSTVVVGPLPGERCPLTAELPLSSKLLLGALVLYGPLLRGELEVVHGSAGHDPRAGAAMRRGESALDLDAELTHLAQLGLVVIDHDFVVRERERQDGAEPVIRIDTRLVQPIAAELRAANLL